MTLYILLYNDGLPKISHIFKLRKQLISHQNIGLELNNYNVEHDVFFKNISTPIYPICIQMYLEHLSGVMKW